MAEWWRKIERVFRYHESRYHSSIKFNSKYSKERIAFLGYVSKYQIQLFSML